MALVTTPPPEHDDPAPDEATLERLTDPRFTAAGLLFEAADGLRDAVRAATGASSLGGAEMQVVMRLARSPGTRLRMADLAAQVAMSASGLTRLIDRLERDGVVRREACPTDKRGAFAVLTYAGLVRITATLDAHLQVITDAYTGRLSAEELASVIKSLRVVRDVVRPHAASGGDALGPCTGFEQG